MYKPLRKRKMGSYTSSLRKIINDEVENKISALKKEGVDPPSKEQESFTTFDYDYGPTLEAPEDYYTENSTMSKENFEKEMGSEQVDIQNKRYTAEQWNKEAEEVSFDNLTPKQKASLDNFYGEDVEKRKGTKILKRGGKFYLDQGDYHTDESGVTKPLEITDPAFNQAPDKAASEEAPSQPSVGSKNIMELFNVNPEFGGSLTENAKSFYDTSYSEDNPVLDVLQDEKWMRKARKEYDKLNLSNQKRSQMPFEKWAMKTYKPKGQDGSLNVMAKSWERANKANADREVTSSKGVVESGYRKGNPFDRETQAGQEQGPETINQFNMNRNASSKGQSKMIKAFGKPMSFRNNKH